MVKMVVFTVALTWEAARDAALDMERAIEASLEENCPALLAMYGCGPVSAATSAQVRRVQPPSVG